MAAQGLDGFGSALDQQHIACLQGNFGHTRADHARAALQAKNDTAELVAEADLFKVLPDQSRSRRHHHLGENLVTFAKAKLFGLLSVIGGAEFRMHDPGAAPQGIGQSLTGGRHHQNVSRTQGKTVKGRQFGVLTAQDQTHRHIAQAGENAGGGFFPHQF